MGSARNTILPVFIDWNDLGPSIFNKNFIGSRTVQMDAQVLDNRTLTKCSGFFFAAETKITCSIPSVPPLRDTVLTCHFPEDLSVTKKDFTVYHYVQHDIPGNDTWWVCKCNYLQICSLISSSVTKYFFPLATSMTLWYNCGDRYQEKIFKLRYTSQVKKYCLGVLMHYLMMLSTESVLDCWWIKGVLDCYTKPGFKFDRRVSQTLNTTIHNVTMANTGFYTCQVAGYSSSLLETCELSLKPGKDTFPDGQH